MHNVNYLISGPAYLPYLAVSCYTLRQHYSGNIRIFAWPGSRAIAEEIARDKRISAKVIPTEPKTERNGHLLQKIEILIGQEGTNLLLDADTLVVGDPHDLFYLTSYSGYTATQFCDWTTQKPLIQKRLKRLEPFLDAKEKIALQELLDGPYYSLNCGVFAARGDEKLKYWLDLSRRAQSIFIPDECAQHLLMRTSGISVLSSGAWNSSPKFRKDNDYTVIWHGHGNMFGRPAKCQFAFDLWCLHYQQAQIVGKMSSWIQKCGNQPLLDALQTKGLLNAPIR